MIALYESTTDCIDDFDKCCIDDFNELTRIKRSHKMTAFYESTKEDISRNIKRKSSKELKEFTILELFRFALALRLQETERAQELT